MPLHSAGSQTTYRYCTGIPMSQVNNEAPLPRLGFNTTPDHSSEQTNGHTQRQSTINIRTLRHDATVHIGYPYKTFYNNTRYQYVPALPHPLSIGHEEHTGPNQSCYHHAPTKSAINRATERLVLVHFLLRTPTSRILQLRHYNCFWRHLGGLGAQYTVS